MIWQKRCCLVWTPPTAQMASLFSDNSLPGPLQKQHLYLEATSKVYPLPNQTRTHRRSLKAPLVKELTYNAGNRAGVLVSLNAPEFTSSEESEKEKQVKTLTSFGCCCE